MIKTRKWLDGTSEWLFKYALDYLQDVEYPTSPKLHTINADEKIGMVSCDFWYEDEDMSYSQLGGILDHIIEVLNVQAYVLLFIGRVNNTEAICLYGYGKSIREPIIYYKPIIMRHGPLIDFGPTTQITTKDIKSLEF